MLKVETTEFVKNMYKMHIYVLSNKKERINKVRFSMVYRPQYTFSPCTALVMVRMQSKKKVKGKM